MRRVLSGLARGERGGEAGEGGQARGIGGLMAAELQGLARGLADHVHQAAQRLDRELADRSRCGIHFRWEGRDLDRCRLARAGEGRDRCRLLEQAGMAAVEQLHEICTAGLGPEVEHQGALGGIEELEQRTGAGRPAAEARARRTGSPPGGSILRTSAPRSAAILAASDVASLRQSGTPASFTSTMVKRCKGRESVVIAR